MTVFPLPVGAEVTIGLSVYITWVEKQEGGGRRGFERNDTNVINKTTHEHNTIKLDHNLMCYHISLDLMCYHISLDLMCDQISLDLMCDQISFDSPASLLFVSWALHCWLHLTIEIEVLWDINCFWLSPPIILWLPYKSYPVE